jgi:hypothetical protein
VLLSQQFLMFKKIIVLSSSKVNIYPWAAWFLKLKNTLPSNSERTHPVTQYHIPTHDLSRWAADLSSGQHSCKNVNKMIQLDATVRRHSFTAESLYMFRASQRPSSGVLKTVTATSGIGLIRTSPDQTTLEGSSCTNIMTYTRGGGYSF